ncbi:MAG: hypothetical protein POELPBGB_02044 [Bacteroidia bacterium]|nr:hypothetical protein [Bacteroidia bacterium]
MNFVAIITAALVPMVLGFIWYHKNVFGTVWMQLTGMTEEKAQQGNMFLKFGLAFLFSIMLAFVMNIFAVHDAFIDGAAYYEIKASSNGQPSAETAQWLEYYKTTLAESNHTFSHGSFHALLLIGVFVIVPVFATNAIFEGKGWKYVAINAGYWIVCVALMGGIIAMWR